MKSGKVLRSVCMLAVACGLVAANGAAAQGRDKPAQHQVRKAGPPVAAAKKQDKAATRKAAAAGKGHAARKPRNAAKVKPPAKPPVKAAAGNRANAPATATRSRRPALPPPTAWVPPPLGPERFYPNGIPELRPEFLHPEHPVQPPDRSATVTPALGGHPELMP